MIPVVMGSACALPLPRPLVGLLHDEDADRWATFGRRPCAMDADALRTLEKPVMVQEMAGEPWPATVTEACVDVSRRLFRSDPTLTKPDAIIVCQTSVDGDVPANASSALRLQCEFGLTQNSFSVGSQDGAAFFTALGLARDLMAVDHQIESLLICCAEIWSSDDLPALGDLVAPGNGAVAVLFGRSGPGWRLRALETQSFTGFGDPAEEPPQGEKLGRYAIAVQNVVERLLVRHAIVREAVSRIAGPNFNAAVTRAVVAGLALPHAVACELDHRDAGYLFAADPALRLHDAITAGADGPGLLLLWGVGLSGSIGAALFEYAG
ncbi:hypothetical protein LWE61_11775 [Sphingobium sufflavum]|uniref:hypothetical protein n=1 Tax=Sphingobium sufflavum TaxID=1129547 RepID=UPI001F32B83A|nr:hypothetical protein [Sphingobium sufflavum]MCE7797236.1 hypothetical protein [Sphingobium sufflavum]